MTPACRSRCAWPACSGWRCANCSSITGSRRNDMTTEVHAPSRRKMALQALIGALAGGGGMFALMWLLDGETLHWQPSQIILAGVGLIYVDRKSTRLNSSH